MTEPANQHDLERADWGKFRAKVAIFIDGVRAFSPGHDVPASHVEKFDLQDQVESYDAPAEAPVEAPKAPQGAPIVINP
jgi:hypothetical protein